MKFIDFDADKCDLCFKCLRVCPTKAIAFSGSRRHIIDERCIKCGLCQAHCQSGALKIQLDIHQVKKAIHSGRTVVVSLAPSFAGAFRLKEAGQIVSGLRTLGFKYIEETAHGAEIVSRHYEKEISGSERPNIITSCCPSANYLIEHYYPSAVDCVIPVMSPMLAHGLDIKERYGQDAFVVFIGPCLAKKAESVDVSGPIDAVITFSELEEWFEEASIDLQELDEEAFDHEVSMRGRAYPLGGSLWKYDMETRIDPKYKYIHVNGIESCESFLESVIHKEIEGYCAEINICSGNCLNGPDMPKSAPRFYERQSLLGEYVKKRAGLTCEAEYEASDVEVHREFRAKPIEQKSISESTMRDILLRMGKYSVSDQLNCGACGYTTCREKAVAVFHGYSDADMCMSTLRQKAESLRFILFENTPNAVCILDKELRVKEVNPSFDRIFNEEKINLAKWPIYAIMEDDVFKELQSTGLDQISKKIYMDSVDRYFYCNIVKLDEGALYVCILTDITDAEKSRGELERVKEETVAACQNVIDKQMRVAQEIASLLGETTAETKIGLNHLKKIVLNDNGGM